MSVTALRVGAANQLKYNAVIEWHGRCNDWGTGALKRYASMNNNSEVVGWVLVDGSARVLMRNESAGKSRRMLSARQAFEHFSVQTGSFHRNQLIEAVTREVLVHKD